MNLSSDHLIADIKHSGESKGWMICSCGWDGPHDDFSGHRYQVLTKDVALKRARPRNEIRENFGRLTRGRGKAVSITGIPKPD